MPVLAPGRFSITTPWPQISDSFCPTIRMLTSVGPPAGNGTTIFTGRLGKLCASCARAGAMTGDGQQRKSEQRAHRHAPSLRVTSSNSSSTVTFLVIICCLSE